jgi:hypothetical protein
MLARWLGFALAVPSLVVVGLVAGSLLGPGGRPGALAVSGRTAGRPHAPAFIDGPPARSRRARGSVVADVKGREAIVYRAPGGRPWRRYLNPTPQGTPLVFLVRVRAGAWLRVMLPSRPNGAEGWVRAAGMELRTDPYSVRIDVRDRRLLVREAGRTVLAAQVGVGRAATPTPSGLYYIAELLRQPNPHGFYGPWAFALSAYSPVLSHFGGGGGQVGIHGTNEPVGIGHTVSHGCIRVRNSVIDRLVAILPLGTPVTIVAPAHQFTRA